GGGGADDADERSRRLRRGRCRRHDLSSGRDRGRHGMQGGHRRGALPGPARVRPRLRGLREGADRMADVKDVTDQDFESEVVGAEAPVLVDFWAEWCVPCHMVSPVVEEIGRDKGDALSIVKLNMDENPEVTRKYGVKSIPTLIMFVAGEE